MPNPSPPIKLAYSTSRKRGMAERLANLFTVVAVIVVVGSGSVAWALLMGHR